MREIVCLVIVWGVSLMGAFFYGKQAEMEKHLTQQAVGQQEASLKAFEQTHELCSLQIKEEAKVEEIIIQKPNCQQLFDTDITECLPK